jgi:hypothetical protein
MSEDLDLQSFERPNTRGIRRNYAQLAAGVSSLENLRSISTSNSESGFLPFDILLLAFNSD